MREVLAFELAKAPVTPAQLIDVTTAWKHDPDDGVRRVTAVGITEAIKRHQRPAHPPSPELTQWRELVREDLRAYGPHLDEDRQIAWTCMLLLDAPELLDGVFETINEPERPGVRLTDIYLEPRRAPRDSRCRELERALTPPGRQPHGPVIRGPSKGGVEEKGAALGALLVSPASPGIASLLNERIATEAARTGESATLQLIESTPAGIDHLIESSGATIENLHLSSRRQPRPAPAVTAKAATTTGIQEAERPLGRTRHRPRDRLPRSDESPSRPWPPTIEK